MLWRNKSPSALPLGRCVPELVVPGRWDNLETSGGVTIVTRIPPRRVRRLAVDWLVGVSLLLSCVVLEV